MEKLLNIGFIGCGLRARAYAKSLAENHRNNTRFVAYADPDANNAASFAKQFNLDKSVYYSDYRLMVDDNELDGVVLASPNSAHIEQATYLFQRNIPFLLEKPVATTVQDCLEILKESKQSRSDVIVGFVLRYAPFYKTIAKIIESNEIGEIMAVSATESVSHSLVVAYNRGWRKDLDIAGPFLLEKCCHDFDIINSIVGANAVKVSSFGGKKYFSKVNQPASNCKICDLRESCLYSSLYNLERIGGSYAATNEAGLIDEADVDICVFQDLHNDHQAVAIEYENGVTSTLTYSWGLPYPSRSIRVMGSKGELFGDINQSVVHVTKFVGISKNSYAIEIQHDNTGHHGADSVLTDAIVAAMQGKTNVIKAGIEDGVKAAIIALAADYSQRFNKIVDIEKFIRI